jgi:iron complex outermembrane receptor protein
MILAFAAGAVVVETQSLIPSAAAGLVKDVDRRWRFPAIAVRVIVGLVFAIVAGPTTASAQADRPQAPLKSLSIEELIDIDVSLPLGRQERVMDAPAAAGLLTSEDIRRSAAVALPDVLRTLPGVFSARFSASSWVITARGFANTAANKLLVMIDGRTVYSPLFSGVFWDQQDTLLEDVERIEVVRGPGGSLWGSNAVNGVINVFSKRAADTQGTLITVGGGAEERFNTAVRYGGRVRDGHFRIYGKYFDRDAGRLVDGGDAHDGQRFGQAGFRVDFGEPTRGVTLQGDAYSARGDLLDRDDIVADGLNLLGRWTTRPSANSDLQVQAYYDQTYRRVPLQVREGRDTADVEAQYRWSIRSKHLLRVGAGYRFSADATLPTAVLFFNPLDRSTTLLSGSIQDEIALTRKVSLIAGSRIEHNDYTGIELQPTARVGWTPSARHTVWGAVSRAVRMPTRFDTDLRILQNGVVVIAGTEDFRSETLLAYEAGYRGSPTSTFAWGVQLFRNHYDDLRTQEPSGGTVPIRIGNGLNDVSSGGQVNATVQPHSRIRVTGSYAYLSHQLRLDENSRDLGRGLLETIDPKHQAQLLVRMDLPHRIEADVNTRHVGALPTPGTPAYTESDVRLAWHALPQLELALIGRDVLHPDHLEFVSPTSTRRTLLQRVVFTRVKITF